MEIPHLRRPCRRIALLYRRTVYRQLSIPDSSCTRSFCRTYSHWPDCRMGKSFHIRRLRTSEIRTTISSVDIINDRDVIDDRSSTYVPDIIIADIHTGNTLPGTKIPIIGRRPVSVVDNANVYPWTNRRPTIITTVFPPGDPCRRPFISRDPHPSVIVIIEPVSVVKGGPTPTVIGDPCPSVLGIHPVATRTVRPEAGSCTRHPDITVIRITDPGAEGTQLIIKHLEAHTDLGTRLRRQGRQYDSEQCNTCHYNVFFHIDRNIVNTSNTITMPGFAQRSRAKRNSLASNQSRTLRSGKTLRR